jgi:hypothetical protein
VYFAVTSLGMTPPALWRDVVSNKYVIFCISACVVSDMYDPADGNYDCDDRVDSFTAAFILSGFYS